MTLALHASASEEWLWYLNGVYGVVQMLNCGF